MNDADVLNAPQLINNGKMRRFSFFLTRKRNKQTAFMNDSDVLNASQVMNNGEMHRFPFFLARKRNKQIAFMNDADVLNVLQVMNNGKMRRLYCALSIKVCMLDIPLCIALKNCRAKFSLFCNRRKIRKPSGRCRSSPHQAHRSSSSSL